MKESKKCAIQVRVTESQKELIKNQAAKLGASVSEYLIALAIKSDSLKILADGQAVAAAMVALQLEIQRTVRNDKIPDKLAAEFLKKLEDISKAFAEILNQTDYISFGEEEK